MSDLELCYTCERYGECDVYSRLSSPGHDLLYSCVNYVPTSAKDIDVPNTDLSDNSTEIALLELEHRYGKGVRDRVEQMGFVIPKTGRWIKNQRKSKFHIEPVYICSCCREQEAWGEMELSNYCPNCGAKMEGEEDE